tara:strand:+ start:91 stop:291 length:201 start_codon:yes stop_codon:yes gene_type:complete
MDSPAKTNQKILMDIEYSLKELNTSVNALKYEIQFIKSNLHAKPIEIKKDIEEETPESIKNWWWSA